MKEALIGYTGFVGSNLKKQYNFTNFYNSKNFNEMKGQQYNLVLCAGVSSTKWMANKEPKRDKANIKNLEDILKTIKAEHFILISTIDVYPLKQGKNEDYKCSRIANDPYGTHRLELEDFCLQNFKNCTIIRLSALFGEGLKKNVIYDLLNDNCLEMINRKSSFQYYYLENLWKDIQKTLDNGIKIINLFAEPLLTEDVLSNFFPKKTIGKKPISECHYDLHTKYAGHWNKSGKYIYTKHEVMEQLSVFINTTRRKKHETGSFQYRLGKT